MRRILSIYGEGPNARDVAEESGDDCVRLVIHAFRHCALVVLCLAGSAWLCAQNQPQSSLPKPQSKENVSPELIEQLEAIKIAALSDDYAYQQLAHLTENIGPRPSGSAGAKAAVEYIAGQMRDLGLEVHLEEVKVRHWVRGVETAALVQYPERVPGTEQKIVLTALGGSTSTGAGGITGELIVVQDFDQLKSLGRDQVAGKIVLFNQKFDKRKAEAGWAPTVYREGVRYRETRSAGCGRARSGGCACPVGWERRLPSAAHGRQRSRGNSLRSGQRRRCRPDRSSRHRRFGPHAPHADASAIA